MFIASVLLSCSSDDSGNNPFDDNCIRVSGGVVTEERDLVNFHSVVNTIPADIIIEQGPLEAVLVEAPSDIMEELKTTVQSSTLTIEIDRCVEDLENVRIFVTIPEIRRLVLTGVGNMDTVGDISTDELDITLTGVGQFNLSGDATTLNISLTGVGNVNAFELMINTCNISTTGTGDVEVNVSDELNVTISGVGFVYYEGNPVITANITGQGAVIDSN